MYTAIRTYTTNDSAELARRVQEEFVPKMRELSGFIGYYVVDQGDGKIASITVCEDRAAVEESTNAAADWVRERLSSLITSGPEVLMGDTTVAETAARVSA
jgi:quinol monooxygenase YgiN